MSATLEEFKQRQRAIVGGGRLRDALASTSATSASSSSSGPVSSRGWTSSTSPAARATPRCPAARAGARVTGPRPRPELLEGGREKAAEEGVEIEWVEGDAEELPFGDASFDRVFSTFGHMFAPRHQQTADEMARVCRDGRRHRHLLLDARGSRWRRLPGGGFVHAAAAGLRRRRPILWGTEEHVREMFGSRDGLRVRAARDTIDRVGVDRRLRRPLHGSVRPAGDGEADARRALRGASRGHHRDLGAMERGRRRTLRLPQEYLLSVIRL